MIPGYRDALQGERSPDGKYFFFATEKTGNDEIYWIDVKALGLE